MRRHGDLTPCHIFTLEAQDGSRRRVVIPGGYCEVRRPTLRPGEREVTRTWRSDLRFIDVASNSQPDYGT
jgi:hypothetical protein